MWCTAAAAVMPSSSQPARWQPGDARRRAGEGTYFTRADGRKVGELSIGSGQDRQKLRAYGRADEAWKVVQQRLAAKRREHERGLPAPRERQTVEQYLWWWLAEEVAGRVKDSTYVNYESVVRVHLVPAFGRVKLVDLSPQHVRALVRRLSRSGLRPGRVGQVRATLRTALADAMRMELVDRNVATLVRVPPPDTRVTDPLSAEQAHALLERLRGGRLYPLVSGGISLGLRPGELLGLKWDDDVDLDGGRLRVRRTLRRVKGGWVLDDDQGPKSPASRKPLLLPQVTVRVLRAHRRTQLEERLSLDGWEDWGLVFPDRLGRPQWLPTVARGLERALSDAGLPRLTPHQVMRHGCGALLRAQGVPIDEIQRVLRHASLAVTSGVYGHIGEEVLRGTAARMDELFGDLEP